LDEIKQTNTFQDKLSTQVKKKIIENNNKKKKIENGSIAV